MTRAHVVRGLSPGGVRLLWSQFPTGPFFSLTYSSFVQIFSKGWRNYNAFKPPISEKTEPFCCETKEAARTFFCLCGAKQREFGLE